ncbi:beta-ketoacyl synthase domain-containing protein [Seiridium cupressi]
MFLFGPQETLWSEKDLRTLQSRVLGSDTLEFLKDAMYELPSLEPFLRQHICTEAYEGNLLEVLTELSDYATGGTNLMTGSRRLTNIHQAPLTVASHIVEFVDRVPKCGGVPDLTAIDNAQGFCVGFLSAAAVASAITWQELKHNFSCALRLAACVACIVDSEAKLDVTAIAIKWKTDAQRHFINTCLKDDPNAYISCWTDDTAATVTVPVSSQVRFGEFLTHQKIVHQPIGLNGYFHSPVHEIAVARLKKACAIRNDLSFPQADRLCMALRNTANAEVIRTGGLTDVALDVTLCKSAHWFQTVKQATEQHGETAGPTQVVAIGRSCRIPRSIRHHIQIADNLPSVLPKPVEEIAVVGVACRFPQADNLQEFWKLIETGSSCVTNMPAQRFDPSNVSRGPKLSTYYGNFLREPAVFDHRFFGMSGREAKSMDPQQRLALQVAYEALESSGYYTKPESKRENDVGVYLGVGAVDYEANVASEDAGAFSATGTLRAFISGRISHYFGWSGPSITFDTACSSSAVAIHSACRALLANECAMAVAGGVNVITSPSLHQNLAAASFLNADGSSKAFDASANGYCRGEGAGLLVLKPLSQALADNDIVLGVISSSACALYNKALRIGGINPVDVTYVEAHGTVGDPIEYESLRSALTGPQRKDRLFVGSVKDNIGHAEAASGAAGIIKTLLMMQRRVIPRQANFQKLNPQISTSDGDFMIVPSENEPWMPGAHGSLVALINNYGAAGSNAAIVLREHQDTKEPEATRGMQTHPILVAAKTENSLLAYLNALRELNIVDEQDETNFTVSQLGPVATLKANPAFEYRAAFYAQDARSWKTALGSASPVKAQLQPRRPVVLCFGGQTGRDVAFSEDLYLNCPSLRRHLDVCAAVCAELQLPQILPDMLKGSSGAASDDIIMQQCRLFTQQYASAMTWLDSGLQVDTIIGHSFGQLTGLCVAGSLSLRDAFRFVAGRARLMRDAWRGERGSMLSVECESEKLEATIELINREDDVHLSVACYNGPRSFVVAGDSLSIDRAEEALGEAAGNDSNSPAVKTSRLGSSHAFHSHLTESILPDLQSLARSVQLRPPHINIETCSEGGSWPKFDHEELVQHTREPVFFSQAVQRIETRLTTGAIWLEAGASSPIISMARRVVNANKGHVLIPIDALNDTDGTRNLAIAACKLWMAGMGKHHWATESSSGYNAQCRAIVATPPYQFEKTEHWIQYKGPTTEKQQGLPTGDPYHPAELPLVHHLERNRDSDIFLINTASPIFELAAQGHAVAGHSLCPASMYMELAIRCSSILLTNDGSHPDESLLPNVQDLTMSAPLGLSRDSRVLLRMARTGQVGEGLSFTIFSLSSGGIETEHARGRSSLLLPNEQGTESRLHLLRRLARGPSRAERILSSPRDGVSGAMVYRIFDEVVTYADYYRGVERVAALHDESAGRVSLPSHKVMPKALQNPGLSDPLALDNFLQVSGIHVNCLCERSPGRLFMCVAINEILVAPEFVESKNRAGKRSWVVHSRFDVVDEDNDKASATLINDIFVYDEVSQILVVGVMGATFKSVSSRAVARNLARLSTQAPVIHELADIKIKDGITQHTDSGYQTSVSITPLKDLTPLQSPTQQSVHLDAAHQSDDGDSKSQVLQLLRKTLSDIIEIPVEEVLPTSKLDELGVDSLLVTEVATEIEKVFSVSVTKDTILGLDTIFDLSQSISPTTNTTNGTQKAIGDTRATSNPSPEGQIASTETSAKSSTAGPEKNGTNTRVLPSKAKVRVDDTFGQVEGRYDEFAKTTGFAKFYSAVYPLQSELVVMYIVEAFAELGCDLRSLETGAVLPPIKYIPKHDKLVPQLYGILTKAEYISRVDGKFRRTPKVVPQTSASTLYETLLSEHPRHASETKLLGTTAPHLAACLSGTRDPIDLLFGSARSRALLEDVYANAPMFLSGTRLLCQYLCQLTLSAASVEDRKEVRILELGAGTGGTTRYLVEALAATQAAMGVEYTFTDLSGSLVTAAKRKFAKYTNHPRLHMKFSVLDLEAETLPPWVLQSYDIVVSTNCVHATRDLTRSTGNIHSMIRPDYEGMLCLIELMPVDLYWFDLVFGLLEGWWLFEDGRNYALANENHWEKVLKGVGFEWFGSSDSPTRETGVLKLMVASVHEADTKNGTKSSDEKLITKETVAFKQVDDLQLSADIYYPDQAVKAGTTLPVALMIHGGGHVMLSRKDVRPEQVRWLLRDGFLPVSIDYRLCPETTLLEGPLTDVADALSWARSTLPKLGTLQRADIVPNGDRVVAVGWSTGGMLALSLGWTRLCRAPDAILAMYCPCDYEDPFWTLPNRPKGSDGAVAKERDDYSLDQSILSACSGKPIAGYNVPPGDDRPVAGGWLAPSDPRSRLALHMNWQGRTLDVLLKGRDALNENSSKGSLDPDSVRSISPLARVRTGDYAQVPTFIIHPSLDDLIPVAQAEQLHDALRERGITGQLRVINGQKHLFDIYPRWKTDKAAYAAVNEGYDFLKTTVLGRGI